MFLNAGLPYNGGMEGQETHPAERWRRSAERQELSTALRLAAMAGHMGSDSVAARRAALVDLLADGRPHLREEIWQTIANQLGEDCWGKLPQEALARDLAALRRGGIRIAYSRRPGTQGYYLQYPALERPVSTPYEAVNWTLIDHIRQLTVPQKNERSFAAADFALRQKKLLLAEAHPEWTAGQVDSEARRLVYGVTEMP